MTWEKERVRPLKMESVFGKRSCGVSGPVVHCESEGTIDHWAITKNFNGCAPDKKHKKMGARRITSVDAVKLEPKLGMTGSRA